MRLIIVMLLLATIGRADWYNTNTRDVVVLLPNPLNATHNPTPSMYLEAGYLPAVRATVPDGQQVVSNAWTVGNGVVIEQIWTEAIPPRIPPAELLQTVAIFRTILRLHFGAGAETNHEVTAQAVTEHFVTRRLTLPSSERLDDASDGMLLTQGFESIIAWTGDGTSWSFPWAMIPEQQP